MNDYLNLKYADITMVVYLCICMAACRQKLETTQPITEDISESVYASGVIKTRHQYEVFATVNGLITEMMVTEGDSVSKGTALIKVRDETPKLNMENAQLAAAYSMVSANMEKLEELKSGIEFARNKMANDSLLLTRQQNLWRQHIGSLNELEQRELAFKNSAANYKAACLKLAQLQKQLSFNASQSKKSLQISRTIDDDYTIRSNMNGRVYKLLKEKGEMVTPQSPVAIIGDANNFMLELQVDEYDIAKIKPGQKIILHLDSYKGEVFEAVVEKIYPIMDNRTRSFTVEARFTIRPLALYPNLTAEANIVIQTKEKALTIPRSFLIEDSFVLLNKTEKTVVKTGMKDYEKVEIIHGLSPGQIIYKPAK